MIAKPRADERLLDDRGLLTRFWASWTSEIWSILSGRSHITLRRVSVAGLPDPAKSAGGLLIVTNDAGGETPAWCDGTVWRRTTDNSEVAT